MQTPNSHSDLPRKLVRQVTAIADKTRSLEGLHSSCDTAFVVSQLLGDTSGVHVWICPDNREAERVASDLRFFLEGHSFSEILVIPGFEADPYRGLSPHPEIAEMRAVGLWRLLNGHQGFVVTTLSSLITRLPSVDRFLNHCLELEVGQSFPLEQLILRLRQLGYVREDPVAEIGEYSKRGGIVDVFSPAHANPVRIEYFGDRIESIREFSPSTQRSVTLIHTACVIPIREFLVSEAEIGRWHQEAPRYWSAVRFAENLAEKLQFTANHELFNGFEYLFPLVIDCDHSLLDYARTASEQIQMILPHPEDSFESIAALEGRWAEQFEDANREGELALEPRKLFFSSHQVKEMMESVHPYQIRDLSQAMEETATFRFLPVRRYHGRIPDLLRDLESWRQTSETTIFVMGSHGMSERLMDILREYELPVHSGGTSFQEALQHNVSVSEGRLSNGFHAPDLQLRILTQEEVFGERVVSAGPRRSATRDLPGLFISDFRDLQAGDYVVHIDHGIGCFTGLRQIGVESDHQEFMELAYRDGAKLYVPLDRLELVQKYSGAGATRPQLDRLGGASWERTKRRIKKSIRQLAEDLLKLYARRETAAGIRFSADDDLMHEFEEAFEFEETTDQREAIRALKSDMESTRPMDRLICGDVGYGKTEVAMRAAFKAVNDSRQVAVLAPTTVLVFQHLNTFRQRFQGFPVQIEMVSRFLTPKEQKDILSRTRDGQVDILIGTHRLLSRDVAFQRLGLIVVDEEQRFGVTQKEQLKRLKTEVDVLTLSATPIPRTLNMSLSGVRDLSIIETPPRDRLAVQTVVIKFNRKVIRSAIDLEMKRQGQVFFVHNSIETIFSIAAMVQQLVPEARVAVAHGQMKEKLLENTMVDFLNYKYDVLVSTTIIENGLDIPRANTLIVNRADRFGLSQLYQLRGRVGRSNRRAYAYLMGPTQEMLGTDARRRLAAIREFSDLGAGFRIAAMDLEIRGAGNLLGAEQHGHINAVGLDLFLKLLKQTIRELKGSEELPEADVAIDLRLDIRIPTHYISDPHFRLAVYKQISSISDERKLHTLREEISDRYGRYPRTVANLLEVAQIRLQCRPLGIRSLERSGRKILLRFFEATPLQPKKLVDLVGSSRRMSIRPDGTLMLEVRSGTAPQILAQIKKLLESLGKLR